jgi:hypothetical protein
MASSGSKGTPCKLSRYSNEFTSIDTDLIRLPSRLDLSPKQAKAGLGFVRRSRACISCSCKHVKQTLSDDG